jgi:hypothetical protein
MPLSTILIHQIEQFKDILKLSLDAFRRLSESQQLEVAIVFPVDEFREKELHRILQDTTLHLPDTQKVSVIGQANCKLPPIDADCVGFI